MAIFKTLVILLPLLATVQSLLPLVEYDLDQMVIIDVVESPLPEKIDCDVACKARCELSSRPNLCHRACGTCCARCECVPSGTSGHYDECPCYANMTTHGGRHKCP